jgi:hypothetical protein
MRIRRIPRTIGQPPVPAPEVRQSEYGNKIEVVAIRGSVVRSSGGRLPHLNTIVMLVAGLEVKNCDVGSLCQIRP